MKKKRRYINMVLLITLVLMFFSCQNKDNCNNLRIIEYKQSEDTIHIDDKYEYCEVFKNNIVLKQFNDTNLLSFFVMKEDTAFMLEYIIDNGFRFIEEKRFNLETSKKIKEGVFLSMDRINSDSVIIAEHKRICIYDFKEDEICYSYTLEEDKLFTFNHSSVQWLASEKRIFSEYIDYTKPENKYGVIQTELFASIDIKSDSLLKVPIFLPENELVKSINNAFHYTLSDNNLIYKNSSTHQFQIFDFHFSTIKTVSIPCLYEIIPMEVNMDNYDEILNDFKDSYIQIALTYDAYTGTTVLILLEPVPERNEEGKKPKYYERRKLCFLFDKNFELIGKIELDTKGFIPDLCCAIDSKIYLITGSSFSKEIIIKTIEYEI